MAIPIRSLNSGFPRMGDLLKATDSNGTVEYYLIGCPHDFGQCAKHITSNTIAAKTVDAKTVDANSDEKCGNWERWVLCSFRPKELIPYAIDEHAFDDCELEYIEEDDYLQYIGDDMLLKGEFQTVTEAFESAVSSERVDETAEIISDFRRFCLCVTTTFATFLFMVLFAMLL